MAIHEKKSVLMFSLEMSKEQLVQRLLCMEGRIDSKRLRSGFLAQAEFPKLLPAADKLTPISFYIDDTPNISVLEIRSKARRHAAHPGLDLVIIDYLQLMSSPGRNESRQTEIAEISRSIKGLARELKVPVMALSQLSREAERDDTGAPKLSHLRESGAIEQDADVVMMLSRPAPFRRHGGGPPEEEEGFDDNTIHVNIAKQRNGPTGKIDLLFDRNIQRFLEPAYGRDAEVHTPAFEQEYPDDDDGDVPF